jgi:hypothetical protein
MGMEIVIVSKRPGKSRGIYGTAVDWTATIHKLRISSDQIAQLPLLKPSAVERALRGHRSASHDELPCTKTAARRIEPVAGDAQYASARPFGMRAEISVREVAVDFGQLLCPSFAAAQRPTQNDRFLCCTGTGHLLRFPSTASAALICGINVSSCATAARCRVFSSGRNLATSQWIGR